MAVSSGAPPDIFSARYTAMISESHSDWNRWPRRSSRRRHWW